MGIAIAKNEVFSLAVMRGSTVYDRVRRRGRFAVPRDLAGNKGHFEKAVKENLNLMVFGLAKQGYRYLGGKVEVQGPLEHLDFSPNSAPDRGHRAQPDPRDLAAMQRFEREEKARAARKPGHEELVDYEIVTTFEKQFKGKLAALPAFRK